MFTFVDYDTRSSLAFFACRSSIVASQPRNHVFLERGGLCVYSAVEGKREETYTCEIHILVLLLLWGHAESTRGS